LSELTENENWVTPAGR